ncbi:MAG: hypothetical protein L6W00_09375 [Lentisphaeria bacterium]|nr:MAG: hypothetical protein L6W00_09375 [Lentisphaeria bacterium]
MKMTNISNFTISENMNARLAEYGLTSAMAEENGWTLCDSIEIQRILGYLPDCNCYEVTGLKIPFTSPVTGEALKGEDGKPYHGIFLTSPHYAGVLVMVGNITPIGYKHRCDSAVMFGFQL